MSIDFFARRFAFERGFIFLGNGEEAAGGTEFESVVIKELAPLFSWGGKLLVRIRRNILDILVILEDESPLPKHTFTDDYLKSIGISFIENHSSVIKKIHFRILFLFSGSDQNYDFERIKQFARNSERRIKFSILGLDSDNGKIFSGGDFLSDILSGIFLRRIITGKEDIPTGLALHTGNLWFNQNSFVLACLTGFVLAMGLRFCVGMANVPAPFILLSDVISGFVALGISVSRGNFWGHSNPQGLATVLTFSFFLYPFLLYLNGFPDRLFFISLLLNTIGSGFLVFVFERLKERI